MKDLFIKFLKEHNLYYRFAAYYSFNPGKDFESFEEYLDRQDPVHYITGAFPWPKTDEGKGYWHDVDGCWNKCREEHSKWEYKITFTSSLIDDKKLFEDIRKLLKDQYGVKTAGNFRMEGTKLSK